jgi:Protein of unknown function (DUF1553)/Protein of unknown function (DUF1549)/Concanavalin A-like lectin/glucanases superfamily
MIRKLYYLALISVFVCASTAALGNDYARIIGSDHPVAWWRFEESKDKPTANAAATPLKSRLVGTAKLGAPGPRPDRYPFFESNNRSLHIPKGSGYVRVTDPGQRSPLDFDKGDSLTLEAWVNPAGARRRGFAYVVGKGRTFRKGFPRDNQNYALRLQESGGSAQTTFLFRDARNRKGVANDYHRWTSTDGFPIDGRWHHVAVTFTFGKGNSLRGYIDGRPVKGNWDMGGKTDLGPVVDDDELWIGSAMAGNAGSTFRGGIDEVAIYRKALSPERIRLRYKAKLPKPYVTNVPLPKDGVLVEIMERVGTGKSWNFIAPKPTRRYVIPVFGMSRLAQKYDANGLRVLWTTPSLVRMTANVTLPKGKLEFLVRSRSGAKLYVDGKLVLTNPFHYVGGGDNYAIRDRRKIKDPDIRTLQPGDTETLATFTGDGKPHRVTLDMIVGGGKKRTEPGEACVAVRLASRRASAPGGLRSLTLPARPFMILSPNRRVRLTEESWLDYLDERRDALIALDANHRREKSAAIAAEWNRRHERVRQWIAKQPAIKIPGISENPRNLSAIDRFIAARLTKNDKPMPLTTDYQFVRRVTLDVVGTIPTPEQIAAFLADKSPDRRAKYIDRLLRNRGWADHWTSYWQDVLAENPNVLKPTLNNTGPFRWWIYESLLDNKPMDRFVTELITLGGDVYAGGPAGFGMAAQNDVPLAAKAHIIGQAFLGVQMKCARCHDAPFHDLKQRDLFRIAAMLKRGPQPVPKTSSVPVSKEALKDLIVKVTLEPGSKVAPQWPFPKIAPAKLPAEFAPKTTDTRQQLAAYITSPTNTRFAKVMVNRIWARYMGRGLVEPVGDWETAKPSHPRLLDWLAREFLASGYDMQHVARLILNSQAYQRQAVSRTFPSVSEKYSFAAPLRRRMTAEQLVDSLFVAAGKRFDAGPMNMDVDGARPVGQFINLGRPRRAWEFASLSNERDRPSLAMPYSQDFVSLMRVFGWREARQDPLTKRDHDPTVLQSAILANGIVGRRITRLSDDSAFTELAVQKQPIEALIRNIYLRMFSRPPKPSETKLFSKLLRDGYSDRVITVDPSKVHHRRKRPTGVSWSNHLHSDASLLKLEMERLVQQGDPPSVRLKENWRLRMEDMIWALMDSPEFLFSP